MSSKGPSSLGVGVGESSCRFLEAGEPFSDCGIALAELWLSCKSGCWVMLVGSRGLVSEGCGSVTSAGGLRAQEWECGVLRDLSFCLCLLFL